MKRRRLTLAALGAAATLGFSAQSEAQGKPVRLIVGFPPGGSTDALARLLAEGLKGKLDGPVVVENRAGAAGRLAVEFMKTSDADGNVILLTPNVALTLYPHVYKRLNYDAQKDLQPVSRVVTFPLVIGVGPKVPASVTTIAELTKWLKANPSEGLYGSSAQGSTPHFVGQMFGKAAGIPLSHVPYKGDAPAVQDLLGGQIALSINPPAAQLPHLAGGRLRILATTGAKRMAQLPDVATLLEAGYKIQTADWFGAFLPRMAPTAAAQRLQTAIKEVLATREFREGIAKLYLDDGFQPAAEFTRAIAQEFEHWKPIVQASGFSLEE